VNTSKINEVNQVASEARFRIQTGGLIFEIEGTDKFVRDKMNTYTSRIEAMLKEHAQLVRDGKIPAAASTGSRGRLRGKVTAGSIRKGLRKPGRQPLIVRTSNLKLSASTLKRLKLYLVSVSGDKILSKSGAVFAIAWFLCNHVLKSNTFSAGDVTRTWEQLGKTACTPPSASVDVVQCLRNLSAGSIGKEWVGQNSDGTFHLTTRGRKVAESGKILRPRGRKPLKKLAGS
jgi:hypothetical protein